MAIGRTTIDKSMLSRFEKIPGYRKLNDVDRSVINKLVEPTHKGAELSGKKRDFNIPDVGLFAKIANKTAGSVTDARNLFQVLPDMDLARKILISAILSPNDLTKADLVYSLKTDTFDTNLSGPLLRIVKEYFEDVYQLKTLLPTILDDILFMKGAYPLAILPESTLDYAINSDTRVSLESVSDTVNKQGWYEPLGVLGSNRDLSRAPSFENYGDMLSFSPSISSNREDYSFSPSFEHHFTPIKEKNNNDNSARLAATSCKFSTEHLISVTDNPDFLKNPMLLERFRKQRLGDVYSKRYSKLKPGLEGRESQGKKLGRKTLDEIQSMFYAKRDYNNVPLIPLLTAKQLDKPNVGHPLVMHLPVESVIPVHVPGNPKQHVAYFLLLDNHGNPITLSHKDDYYSDIRNNLGNSPDMSSQLLQMSKRAQYGRDDYLYGEINAMTSAYMQIVEKDLLNRLRSGLTTGNYEISYSDEIKRMMFSRALAKKNTVLLFVPCELMNYMAFDYNEYGVGKSLLEDNKMLGALRATLLFASTMAACKNATGTQILNINVPEGDEDPYDTVTSILNLYGKVNRESFPIYNTHPVDIVTSLADAGKQVVVTGSEIFPDVKFTVESREGSHKEVNLDLSENLRARHIQSFGLTPETLDATKEVDFATQVVNNHVMLLKRVVQYQQAIKPFLIDFVRQYIFSSSVLLDELIEFVKSNKKLIPKEYKKLKNDNSGEKDQGSLEEQFIVDFIEQLQVELPPPITERLSEQMKAFNEVTEAYKAAIDAYIHEEMFDTTRAQELFDSIPTIKAVILSMMQRNWLRNNNVLPELDIFNTAAEDKSSTFDLLKEQETYTDGILKSIEEYMRKANASAKKRKVRLAKINGQLDDSELDADDTPVDEEPVDNGVDETPDDTEEENNQVTEDDLDGIDDTEDTTQTEDTDNTQSDNTEKDTPDEETDEDQDQPEENNDKDKKTT